MRPILLFTAGGLALLAAPPVLAQPTDVGPVTVTRATTLPADAVGATVVTEQDILLRQAASPREVLNTIPGLSVERTGAFGGLLTVRQRGASTDKTLVLLNGVPLNDPSQPSGSTDVNLIDMADVTRIEVLSGPQGSLWGSSAIGGVIAFTARPLDGWRAALEGGAFGYARGAASIGVVTDRFQAGLSAAGWRADGISQADERDGNPEADGAWSYTVGGQGRFAVTPNLGVFGQLRYLQTRADTDGYPPPNFTFADTAEWAENRTWFGQAGLDANTLGFGHRLTYGYYDVDRANLGGDFPSLSLIHISEPTRPY